MSARPSIAHHLRHLLESSRVITTPAGLAALLSSRTKAAPRIGELAIAAGVVTSGAVEAALVAKRAGNNARLGDILVGMGAVSREALDGVIEAQTGAPLLDLRSYPINTDVLDALSPAAAKLYQCIPVDRLGGALVVAFAVKPSADQQAAVRFACGLSVEAVVAVDASALPGMLTRYYADTSSTYVRHATLARDSYDRMSSTQATPAGFFRYVTALAIGNGASDIHLRPQPSGRLKAHIRVDGAFRVVREISASDAPALVRHIEILTGIDPFTRLCPKEGRMTLEHEGRPVDLRVSVISGVSGDSVVMRVLDPSRQPTALSQLALPSHLQSGLEAVLQRPHGLLIAAGPTGSGKTTLLYTLLRELHARNLHVVTAEDPVECVIEGINQFETKDFDALLPQLLRHDPDVVMVGELRNERTVAMAINAALTGHLVLSTVHANDSAATVHRLLGLGAKMPMLTSCLAGVFSQRLVRLTCGSCAGAGCSDCGGTGFAGRSLAAELARPSPALGQYLNTPTYAEVHAALKFAGDQTLDESITCLARAGRTTWTEARSMVANPDSLRKASAT